MKTTDELSIFTGFAFSHSLKLKNRILVAPMTRIQADKDGSPNRMMKDYYKKYAEGGFSAIITEGVYPDDDFSKSYHKQPGISTEKHVEGWKSIVREVQALDCKIICQLMHGGAISQCLDITIAPSAIQPLGQKMPSYGGAGAFPMPSAMNLADIRKVVENFAKAAHRACNAGFDGIEIHAANGYLIDQFLTDYTNTRKDAYGGSVPGQVKILGEIIQGIRQLPSLPENFLVGIRLSEGKVNNLSYRWPEGAKRARQLLKEIHRFHPDYIHIASEGGPWDVSCLYEDGSSFSGLARKIAKVPVIANGGLQDTCLAGRVLEEGHGDLISLGKAALGNPSWPESVKRELSC